MQLDKEVRWKTTAIFVIVGLCIFVAPGLIALGWWLSQTPELPSQEEVWSQLQTQGNDLDQCRELVLVALAQGGNVTLVRNMAGGFGPR